MNRSQSSSRCPLHLFLAVLLSAGVSLGPAEEELNAKLGAAFQQAATQAAPTIVLIETAGGLDRVGQVLKGQGPTTGLVLSPDGYVVTSSFNFSHKPASVLVTLPDGTRKPASQIASDLTRKITLLKVEAEGLAVPVVSPQAEVRVGQWVVALGRGWGGEAPALSVGIVSALNRVWGKAVQTDAKVSPANYGGPLVDLQGRVIGILVPLSPMTDGAMAGFEWYDSGIGFAIPLQNVLDTLPRLKKGEDLKRGILGVQLLGGLYQENVKVLRTFYKSPAAEAGILKDDQIIAIDGKPIRTQADLRYALADRYAGDSVDVKVRRGDKEVPLKCTLAEKLRAYERPMLGVLPSRKPSKEKGAVIRRVLEGSPAETLKLQAGDRIMKIKDRDVGNAQALAMLVWTSQPEETMALEVLREKETLKLEAKLLPQTATVPDQLEPEKWIPEPEPQPKKEAPKAKEEKKATEGKAPDAKPEEKGKAATEKAPAVKPEDTREEAQKEESKKQAKKKAPPKPKTGEIRKALKKPERSYWAYVPSDYDPRRPMGLLVWLHPRGATLEKEVKAAWKQHADDRNLCLLGILAGNVNSWGRTDESFVAVALADLMKAYRIDGRRVVIHGHKEGAALALKLGFAPRNRFRGVFLSELPRRAQVQPGIPQMPQSFLLLYSKGSRSVDAAAETVKALREVFHPVLTRELPAQPEGYLPAALIDLAARWLDSLDRI